VRTRLVVNVRSGLKYDVLVDRSTDWGNPYTHRPLEGTLAQYQVATREEAVARYEDYLLSRPDLIARLPELRGKVLGCWCWPLRCHAEILAHYANLPGR
jgi:hypothetical protein